MTTIVVDLLATIIINLLATVGFITIIRWLSIPFESKGKKGDEILHYTDED